MPNKTMKMATLTGKKTIVFSQADIPSPGPDEVLIQVRRMGICGSDIHAYHGAHPYMSFPIVLGHEMSGVVDDAGKNASNFKKGERVTVMPQLVCGQCPQCLCGRYNICESLKVIGCQSQGAAAEYMVCPQEMVKRLPDSMGFDAAAMIEPAAVGVHAARRLGDIRGKNAAVLGAGTIGNLCAQAAMALGAKNVLITDLSDYRLGVAKACGVPNAVNPSAQEPDPGKWDGVLSAAIEETFGPAGADVVFECVGVEATAAQAINISKKGRDIVIMGVFGKKTTVDMGLVQDKELRIAGSLMYVEDDFSMTMKLIDENKIKVAPLMSARYAFDDYAEAFAAIEADGEKLLKVLIEISK